MNYQIALTKLAHQPLTHQLLVSLLKEYDRPNDKIHALLKEGVLQAVKKGLYVVGPALQAGKEAEPFLLANHLLGPSYVSVETALAYYGCIPEKVYEIASMTVKTSRVFTTTLGRFSYTKLPLPYCALGIRSLKLSDDQYALVASPEKALCDKIITTPGLLLRSKKGVREFLLENMRMDESTLRELNVEEMNTWKKYSPKEESISMLINTLQEI